MTQDSIVIVGAARTPIAGMSGDFDSVTASELGGAAIKSALDRSGLKPEDVDEILMGNVLSADQGQAPARQAGFPCWFGQERASGNVEQDVRIRNESRDDGP